MSDERDEDERDEDEAPAADEADKGGLGLTEEFARIEAEIEREIHGRGANDAGDGGTEEERADSESLEVRWDDDDSAEGPAPIPVDAGRGDETGEWSTEAAEAEPAESVADEPVAEEPVADEPVADEPVAEEPIAEEPVAEEPAVPEPPATPTPEPPATEHTIVRPRPLAPRPPAAVAMGAGGGGPIQDVEFAKTPALWWRFLTGSVLIVVSVATSISVFLLVQATEVVKGFQPIPNLPERLNEIVPGDPQTILIVGSDERSDTPGDPGRSDTTMLLRVDADSEVLSVFSLPRDLKVEIPGYGTGRLNEAFTAGGVAKTLDTVEQLTGEEVDIVVNVDFQGFADAVDAIECVYIDVDRKYFHSNEGLYGDQQYAEIDINAGYQRLCGLDALAYVRYRHEDNDIVRAARQQDFLREARQKIPPTELVFSGKGNDLIDIFTKYTSTNIDDPAELIGILKSFISVRDVPVQQVSFEGNLADVDENGVAYVTATQEQIDKAIDQFLNGATTEGPRGGDQPEEPEEGDGDKKKNKSGGDDKKEDDPTEGSSVIEAGPEYARFGTTSARRLKFPVWVPTAVVPGSTYNGDGSRQYEIKNLDDDKEAAYKLVIAYQDPSTVTEYYGVQGTTWSDPPILKNKSESREIDGRTYDLYYDGDRLRIVAWHDLEGNSYWVSNTLAHSLEEVDMLAIAATMNEAHG